MEKQNSQELQFDDYLIKYLIGSATAEERQMVLDWLAENDSHKLYFDQLRELYFLGKVTKFPSGFDRQRSLERIKRKYYQARLFEVNAIGNSSKRWFTRYKLAVSIAATFTLALVAGYLIRSVTSAENAAETIHPVSYNEVVTPKGSRTNITLPDGTQVWLNADSRLKYAMDFLKEDREVVLSGEAFFDVAKIAEKKFIVNASNLSIRVWGTKFNVKAYPDENTIQTTLVEGSVSIRKSGILSEKELYLIPNQTAIFYKTSPELEEKDKDVQTITSKVTNSLYLEKKVNTILYTSWKDTKWVIEGQTLEVLAKELERRYNVSISFEDESIKSYRFNGIVQEETFEQVLKVIKMVAPIDYEVNLNYVLLKENKNSRIKYDKFLKR